MIYIAACLSMLVDHIGRVFFPGYTVFVALGRLAFPLFAWGVSRGYRMTISFQNYALRLLFISLVSQIPYFLLFHSNNLNVCFTLLAGLICLKLYTSQCHIIVKFLTIAFILMLSELFKFEYGIYGLLVILMFYIFDDKEISFLLQLVLAILYVIIKSVDPVQLIASLSPILIMYLKNIDFKINRAIRYAFYPGHLLFLYIVMKGVDLL